MWTESTSDNLNHPHADSQQVASAGAGRPPGSLAPLAPPAARRRRSSDRARGDGDGGYGGSDSSSDSGDNPASDNLQPPIDKEEPCFNKNCVNPLNSASAKPYKSANSGPAGSAGPLAGPGPDPSHHHLAGDQSSLGERKRLKVIQSAPETGILN